MRNWRKWEENQAKRSKRASYAAQCRWQQYHADLPPRATRRIEIEMRDSHRPMQVIRAEQCEGNDGRWTRWRIDGCQCRPVASSGLARLIAEALQ